MSDFRFPKILIVGREVWNDTTASTLSNLFENYDPDKLAYMYIETKNPYSKGCHRFFQISEFALVHKLYKWRTKTGRAFDTKDKNYQIVNNDKVASQEAATMQYVRGHRSFWFTFAREILWAFNGWKSRELKQFIKDYNPDVIFIAGSPLILMNRLSRYVIKIAEKPYCVYEMDDVYPTNRLGWNPFKCLYRTWLRGNVSKLIKRASQLFVISPKMKSEYDAQFGTNSTILAKGIDFSKISYHPQSVHKPIQMVYMGQVIYDRLSSLELIGMALDEINEGEQHIVLNIYTRTPIEEERKAQMVRNGNVVFHESVPYAEVQHVIEQNDVVVFVESLRNAYKHVARLSFSTKITDYLASGKCIFAVGPSDSAPIEYFMENDSAIVACDYIGIKKKLQDLLSHDMVNAYSLKAYNCGKKNHDKTYMNKILYGRFVELAKSL